MKHEYALAAGFLVGAAVMAGVLIILLGTFHTGNIPVSQFHECVKVIMSGKTFWLCQ